MPKSRMRDWEREIDHLIEVELKPDGIDDEQVLTAMRKVRRDKFIPQSLRERAYGNYPLPIGEEQTISQPYIVALMSEKLELKNSDKVLEIGTGSGYQAAILSLITQKVYTIEIIPSLAQSAAQRLKEFGYTNIYVKCGDGFLGWPEAAPFDAIIITCAPPEVPRPLIDQLAEGGRLIVPLGEDYQVLTLYEKVDGKLTKNYIAPVRFVPMKGIIEEQ